MLSGKRIILGITGGIAAYKAAFLLRAYQKEGAEVRVTMTPSATRFVGVETISSLSKHEVAIEIFPESGNQPDSWTRHIQWGEWADLFVIAPCTANTLAKIAHGISDNMLTSTVLAARCPLLICPTMDGEMYQAAATKRNLKILSDFGYHLLEPEEGYLASGLEGKGRLPDPESILEKSSAILSKKKDNGPLSGKSVLVTAGPTREHIDPVRFISNPSSGKMGFAMAKAARDMGADVTLIHGPVSIEPPKGIRTLKFESTQDLFEKVKEHADHDVIIMAAAVSDFSPAKYEAQKIKKEKATPEIKLERTTDILAWLGSQRKEGQTLIGFAMETENLLENARKKLEKKNVAWIAANSLSDSDSGFEVDTNSIELLSKEDRHSFKGTKEKVARQMLQHIFGKQAG
ncbi:bifunctional phosphopantothenoylcysteine decarboxylase/phosphopantothenate--cysteine ligase CoaBC [Balneolaceae bacterium YR4-1]|uniref:Coenzyme A biosynthesis bifunctional protein CoaBC n=1 Tax=Halalkalibaculum roseum TaxID=2709311 RepID=A0A6M1SXU5_9BACT|nr:bifunctional phosphopantothenoylcysteine decarboxylase/phosphopantothenate--cysteine ligase CoaBC [Halalkalibaculum roseum]NGP77098.1 bifunctional phosphopantothenoylcysteine decarboxylase/phosphopantothenate--cysteine ligase CoaBC [Halalkalibaculum roseum]